MEAPVCPSPLINIDGLGINSPSLSLGVIERQVLYPTELQAHEICSYIIMQISSRVPRDSKHTIAGRSGRGIKLPFYHLAFMSLATTRNSGSLGTDFAFCKSWRNLVGKEGFEPPSLSTLGPKPNAYASSATCPKNSFNPSISLRVNPERSRGINNLIQNLRVYCGLRDAILFLISLSNSLAVSIAFLASVKLWLSSES